MLPPSAAIWLAGSVALLGAPAAAGAARLCDRLRRDASPRLSAARQGLLSRARSIRFCSLAARWRSKVGWRSRLLRVAAVAVIAISGIVIAPVALPILPPATSGAYAHALGMQSTRPRWNESDFERPAAVSGRHVRLARDGREGRAASTTPCRPRSAPRRCSSAATTAKPPLSTSTARRSTARRRSAATTTTISGDRCGFDGSVVIVVGDTARYRAQFDSVTRVGEIRQPLRHALRDQHSDLGPARPPRSARDGVAEAQAL